MDISTREWHRSIAKNEVEELRIRINAYKSLVHCLEQERNYYKDYYSKAKAALTLLDSEREANARLTEELEKLRGK